MTEIRPARPADATALAALTIQLGYPVTADAMALRLSAILAAPQNVVFVSCDARDEPVGWIHVAERHLLESDRYCEIAGLVIDSEHRRQGRAARLVAVAEQWALGRGYREITVRSNIIRAESHPFYERIGYVRVKTQHVYRKALSQREAELDLSSDQAAELDRRWAEHVKNPDSAISWDEIRRKILNRE